MVWSRDYCFKVTVHKIVAELCPFENFCKFFVSGLLLQLTSNQAETSGVVGWCEGVMYLASPGRPADIDLQLGKACYPCSR